MPIPSSPIRPYLGESAAERVLARRTRLLEAANAIMAAEGWKGVSIRALCREAELNKRYFYESFADLDELAGALVDDLATQLTTLAMRVAVESHAAGMTTEVLAHTVLREVIEFLTDDPQRARVLFTEVASSEQALAHRRTAERSFALALSAYGHMHHEANGATDPIAPLAATVLIGGSIDAIIEWLDGNLPMTRDQLITELSALWVITGDGAAARAKARR